MTGGPSGALHKIEDMAIPKKAPGSAGKQTATDVVHDVEGAGKGKGGLSTAEKDLESGAKGKSGVSGVESDIAKGKGDIKKAEDMHKAEGMAKKI
ncbi:hypothetical protein WJX84_001504 [Apatococcus fuscideae]|uniref:Uncharacterized protein n=1 Tax=Apatococcus fuscideae TaxID=2026836 RepID=A0AAW1SUT3_9CHLO